MHQIDVPEPKYNNNERNTAADSAAIKKNGIILIADDNQMNRSMLADILGNEFTIMEAADGIQVLNILRHWGTEIKLMLLDMMMPERDGFEVLIQMKEMRLTEHIPVLTILPSESSPSYLKRAYDLGITDYVSWPFDVTVVRNRVINAILLHSNLRKIADLVSVRMNKQQSVGQDPRNVLFSNRGEEMEASKRTLQLLEQERVKYQFFASMSEEIQFEYTPSPPMVTLSDWGAERLGINAIITEPCENEELIRILGEDTIQAVKELIEKATPERPVFHYEGKMNIGGEQRWHRMICRKMWLPDDKNCSVRVIGKLLDIHEDHVQMVELKRMAYYDGLTGLLNHANARLKIRGRLESKADGRFALAIFDLDFFKEANDNFGHAFGDRVLQHVAGRLRGAIRSDDIAARVGGDEFMIFLEYKTGVESIVKRILNSLSGEFNGFFISVSMGIARTEVVGTDYDTLFQCADQALYSVKRSGRGTFRFYDDSLKNMLSAISPIDEDQR